MHSFDLKGNWIDLVIILILLFFLSDTWKLGFWIILADFLGLLLSLVIAIFGYSYIAKILRDYFTLSYSLSNALGFFFTAGIAEALLSFIFVKFIKKIPYKFWKSPWSNIAGIIPALGQGLIITSFILVMVMGLPLSPRLKEDVNNSKIGGFLITETSGFEARVNEIFGGLIEDSLTYLTVKPESQELVPLTVDNLQLTEDPTSEKEMFDMVNGEREKRGIIKLSWSSELMQVARKYALKMWQEQFFGHVSPEGEKTEDRLEEAGIVYTLAGENLALAPTVKTAHTGLMNSEGHRENILNIEFKKIGIGVIDNGIYGKMFVQLFTD